MSNKVIILIKGYAKKIENGWLASSTTTLVKSSGKNLIVDPGCNREQLLKELMDENLKPDDIDFVLITHSHTDHLMLMGIFQNAKVLDDEEIYTNDHQIEHSGSIPGTDLTIIQTIGHAPDHCTLIVPTAEGTYAIAGDLFWWMDSEEQKTDFDSLLTHPDPYVKNLDDLTTSRKKVLKLADYIVPGHGKVFKSTKY